MVSVLHFELKGLGLSSGCDCVAFLSEVLYSRYASPPGCVAGREGRVTHLFTTTTLPGRNSKVTSFFTLCKFHSL